MSKKNVHVFAIDPQYDFCQPRQDRLADLMKAANGGVETIEMTQIRNGGALYVPGAEHDITRASAMINRLGRSIRNITVTLDSHHDLHVAHPIMWIDSSGNHPGIFTTITLADVDSGKWSCSFPQYRQKMRDYVAALEANKRYPLCIWPPHCIIGSNGFKLMPEFDAAIRGWCQKYNRAVTYVTKGSNHFTEHYGAVRADVVDPGDSTTMINGKLCQALSEADEVLVLGEALSHCVANTVLDVISEIGADAAKKFVIITDACSNVPGFEKLGNDFLSKCSQMGVRTSTTTTYNP